MAIVIAPTSLDTELSTLLKEIDDAKIQLPEFQRNWTWDDDRIKGILASLSQGYPVGAIMRLTYGNDSVRFKYRTIEGVKANSVVPDSLVLDGQQRLTSMYRAIYATDPVDTKTEKGKQIERFYYLDINKCLDETEDRFDAILSIPKNRQIKTNFDRDIVLDLSTRELEFEKEMFPVNIIFNNNSREDWSDDYKQFYNYDSEHKDKYNRFRNEVLDTISGYKLPVITLGRKCLLKIIEKAMGKPVADKEAEQTIQQFGASLADNPIEA